MGKGIVNMIIRQARNKDLKKIKNLVKNGLEEFGFYYSEDTSESDLKNIESEYFAGGGTFLMMENDQSELIAIGALKNMGQGTFKIRKMYVDAKFRGSGYGRNMLMELIRVARDSGATRVILETSSRMNRAIQLYRSSGFKEIDTRPASPRCDITMMKEI